jgi:hypothetical protein
MGSVTWSWARARQLVDLRPAVPSPASSMWHVVKTIAAGARSYKKPHNLLTFYPISLPAS